MAFSRFSAGVVVRVGALFGTFTCLCWLLINTRWYVTIGLAVLLLVAELFTLIRYASSNDRELARFLDAVVHEDTTQSFLNRVAVSSELGAAMNQVLELLRESRKERDRQARYVQTVLAHVPVALITVDPGGRIDLLNVAAKRLFGSRILDVGQLRQFGESFAAAISELPPGASALVRLEHAPGLLHLKVAATAFTMGGQKQRVISFQNIESELSAQELEAWQSVIRVMAHEVMNSLTPISSLSDTALSIVLDVTKMLAPDEATLSQLSDARDALEAVARRSEGLLNFVQSHRRVTQRLSANPVRLSVRRLLTQLQALFAEELSAHNVSLKVVVEPEILEVVADEDLVEQALINLIRNSLEAMDGCPGAQLGLGASRNMEGRVEIFVADNGPGVEPSNRDRIFVPFFTTKRQGSGVGLMLVRQIALAHDGTVELSKTPGGGATFTLTF